MKSAPRNYLRTIVRAADDLELSVQTILDATHIATRLEATSDVDHAERVIAAASLYAAATHRDGDVTRTAVTDALETYMNDRLRRHATEIATDTDCQTSLQHADAPHYLVHDSFTNSYHVISDSTDGGVICACGDFVKLSTDSIRTTTNPFQYHICNACAAEVEATSSAPAADGGTTSRATFDASAAHDAVDDLHSTLSDELRHPPTDRVRAYAHGLIDALHDVDDRERRVAAAAYLRAARQTQFDLSPSMVTTLERSVDAGTLSRTVDRLFTDS
ncbi:hypothetical protein C475_08902 [Halosimplex carlsbadense 2-9-1]|uniref:Uncharacterized protein n=1 Tax=Halosimplex carlsbadense 2-9-1 TaxID=797114 RepID=M0CVU5_9EURY|nr:hypothetical protein [Halosimplex carlsbadense]ELZ26532.1 hypothetical protein C475_08902 [Halosimplex carlsbadense 2-9-1]